MSYWSDMNIRTMRQNLSRARICKPFKEARNRFLPFTNLNVLLYGLLQGVSLDLVVEVPQPVVGVHLQLLQQLPVLCKHVLRQDISVK
jgi:hypothetical protein